MFLLVKIYLIFSLEKYTFEKFTQSLKYWTCGLNWLSRSLLKCPDNNLNCLNEANKEIIQSLNLHNTYHISKIETCNTFQKFSKLAKLIKTTAFVFKFIDKYKRNKDCLDYDHRTKLHLFKLMQEQARFFRNSLYKKNPKENNIPDLVRSLYIFLDSDGFLRTDGRIINTPGHEYGLIYSILIAKHHFLTELTITDCHNKCKHFGINATVTKLRMSGFWYLKPVKQ